MAKKERQRKRKARRKLRISLVIGVLIYFMFRLVPVLYGATLETYTVVNGDVTLSSKTEGIIIRHEQVFNAVGYGKLSLFVDEGKRIGVGAKIAAINLNQSANLLSDEVDSINQQIETIEEQTLEPEGGKNDRNPPDIGNENKIINQIKKAVASNDYEEVKKLKKDLVDQAANKDRKDNYERYHELETLLTKKSMLLKSKTEGNHQYIAQESGVISFEIDGLENVYTPSNMTQITYETFPQAQHANDDFTLSEDVKYGQPLYRLCDNYKWYIATKVNLESMDYLSEGKNVNVKIEDDDTVIQGTVEHITTSKNGAVAVLSFTTDFYRFYDERYVSIEVVYKQQEGLKIPREAIDSLDGIEGVYQKKMNKIIKFRPIRVIFEDEEYAIVESGYIEQRDGKETRDVKTIDMYDEIILNIKGINKEHIIR